jgi:cytochrome d ubiquinol oxidase subunit I
VHEQHARLSLRVAVLVGLGACLLQLFPTGDQQGKLVAEHQRPALAAMEGKFESSSRADLAIIGQPNVAQRRLENPVVVPSALSFLAYGSFGSIVSGLDDIPRERWPDNVELLYYAYHLMVGLGTLLILVMLASAALLWRQRLYKARSMLWVLMLAFPFPYVATTAGWMTAELGRQPWVVYGLERTADGTSPNVGTGDVVFTTIGFAGLYLFLGMLFVLIVARLIARGPSLPAHA